jgi:hypothetical protein
VLAPLKRGLKFHEGLFNTLVSTEGGGDAEENFFDDAWLAREQRFVKVIKKAIRIYEK